jgi:hypothetical protein
MNLFGIFGSFWLAMLATSLFVSPILGQSKGRDLFNHVHTWLPTDVQILYVSNRPFQGFSFTNLPAVDQYAKLVTSATAGTNDKDPLQQGLMNLKVSAGLYVGRGFRLIKPRNGLGLNGRPEGCSLILTSQTEIATVLRPALAGPIRSFRGKTFYQMSSPVTDSAVLIASAPEPDLLMVCNDLSLASEILERKSTHSSGIAFEPHDFLWQSIDVDAPAWGVRRFASTQQDPTSPLSQLAAIISHYKDPGAVAMTFVLQSNSIATVTYVTRTRSASKEYEEAWGLRSTVTSEINNYLIKMQFDATDDNMLGLLWPTLLGLIIVV